jgi:TolB-like protein
MGMAVEFENRRDLALKLYEGYNSVSRLSPYRKLLAGRYQLLTRQTLRAELRALLQQEQRLGAASISSQCIAVFPFRYLGQDKKFASLGRGLSEMMITDLGKVRELKLLERIRLQILLDEIALAQTEAIDKNSAPRFGKLLGAGRIIAGTYNVLPSERVQLEILSWDIANRQVPAATNAAEALKNLFKAEKDLVFKLIAKMGIELTPQEREKIQRIPTKNLQAFLAYCQALEKEDAGQFNAALQLYQKAVQLDPTFSNAKMKAETAAGLSQVGGSKEQAFAAAQAAENFSEGAAPKDLVTVRLNNLGSGIGANLMSGQETREPAEEADLSGAGLGGSLQRPLPPPK